MNALAMEVRTKNCPLFDPNGHWIFRPFVDLVIWRFVPMVAVASGYFNIQYSTPPPPFTGRARLTPL